MALRFLPSEPKTSPTDFGDEADAARDLNMQASKAHLRRGKALLVLRRPRDALRAYVDSRSFFSFSKHPATSVMPGPDSHEWPPFLKEGVAQIEAAIAADCLDSQSSVELSLSRNEGLMPLKPTELVYMAFSSPVKHFALSRNLDRKLVLLLLIFDSNVNISGSI